MSVVRESRRRCLIEVRWPSSIFRDGVDTLKPIMKTGCGLKIESVAVYPKFMVRKLPVLLLFLAATAFAKNHVVTFGTPMKVKLLVGPDEKQTMDITVRTLVVDGRIREFVTGDTHDVTDHVVVARVAFRVNDSLPDDGRTQPKWRWQRGGWVSVDRESGHVASLSLPDFDPYYSVASWYRDYVAYCGVSSDATKVYAVVAELGSRKPVVRSFLGGASGAQIPDSECSPPVWARQPTRVTFTQTGKSPVTFEVHGHAAEPQVPEEPEPETRPTPTGGAF